MYRRFISILLCALLMCASASADIMFALCKPGDIVNVRSAPTSKSSQMGMLDCGDEVNTDGIVRKDNRGNKWIHVLGFEDDAWVNANYLQESPVTINRCYATVASRSRVAVRRSPNGKRTKWLKTGDEVNVLAYSDEWILTTGGYVKAEFMEVHNGSVE